MKIEPFATLVPEVERNIGQMEDKRFEPKIGVSVEFFFIYLKSYIELTQIITFFQNSSRTVFGKPLLNLFTQSIRNGKPDATVVPISLSNGNQKNFYRISFEIQQISIFIWTETNFSLYCSIDL